jgi:hypothetical protein
MVVSFFSFKAVLFAALRLIKSPAEKEIVGRIRRI